MFSIDEPPYCFSAITQSMAHVYVTFSHFDVYFIKDINNLIFQIFTFNGLWDTLYYYIVPSTILTNIICFNFIIYQGIL